MICVCGHHASAHRTTRLSVPLTASGAPNYPIKTLLVGANITTYRPTATYTTQVCDGGCGCASLEPDDDACG